MPSLFYNYLDLLLYHQTLYLGSDLLFFVSLMVLLFPEITLAQSPFDAVSEQGNSIVDWAINDLWVILSTIAVLVTAAAVKFGKINWPLAVSIIIAIILGFHAQDVVLGLKG